MQLNKALIIAVVSLVISAVSSAQTYTTGTEIKKADIDFTESANYYAEHPLPFKRMLPFDESEESERPEGAEPDPSEVHMIHRDGSRLVNPNTGPSYLPVSFSPVDTFLSTVSNGEDIPPDTHGDVNADYCVTAINSGIDIHNRAGVRIHNIALDGFWATVLPAGTDAFDPKINYDPIYRRWVLVTDAVNQTTMATSTLLVGVSETCNPTGRWHLYAIPIDPTGAAWLDYPNIGFNNQWVTITGNMFANTMGGATGAVAYVFNYASLMSGAGAPFVKISEPASFTLCPARAYEPTNSMYLVEVNNSNMGRLKLWKITGAVGSPTITSVGLPTSTTHWKTSGPGGNDFAAQLGTTNKLDAGDDRIHRFVYRNGKLWCAHTIFLPATGTASRCSIMWWQMDTLANPLQNGVIDDPTTPSFYMYPSIAVNANDDALIGFSYTSTLVYPDAAYIMRLHTDPVDSMRPAVIFRHGQTNYFQNFGGAKNRWGDYSAATVDPVNDLDFWTIEESVPSSPANYWDTWWAHVQVSTGTPGLSAVWDTVHLDQHDTLKFAGIIPAGTIATWNFNSGTAVPGTGTGTQVVDWTTTGIKVVILTDSVPGCTLTFTDTILVSGSASVKNLSNVSGQNIQVLPNPNNGIFDILFSKPVTSGDADVKLIDMQGRVVLSSRFSVSNSKISVETNNLPPGNYVVNIDIDGGIFTQKVSIEK